MTRSASAHRLTFLLLAIGLASGAPAGAAGGGGGPNRARDLADFEARLAASASATEVLRGWCADHRLADPPVIRALRAPEIDRPADRAIRRLLRAAPGEAIRYRRVRLVCGSRVLSEADNWYRPGQLTQEMNRRLDETDAPFGQVVRPLDFHRQSLEARRLADPARGGDGDLLRRRALLISAAGAPFSLVVETYTAAVLDLAPATPPAAPDRVP